MYPWANKVEPVWLDPSRDLRLAARIAETKPESRWIVAKQAGVYYRVGAPRLGEPLKQMGCGRGTGHYGSGLYFFGTLEGAQQSNYENNKSLEGIYRVIGGPQKPYLVGINADIYSTASKQASWDLHKFGKALLCLPAAREDRFDITRELESLDPDTEYWIKEEISRKLREQLRELNYEISRFESTLKYRGPRLDMDLQRAEYAISASAAEGKYHPMTYYMLSLGYDGIIHTDPQMFDQGDIGNIWYPEPLGVDART